MLGPIKRSESTKRSEINDKEEIINHLNPEKNLYRL